jgi:phage gpG-like protein
LLNITMTAVNAREVEMAFAGFASDVSDLRSVWPLVAQELRQMTVGRQFPSEGGQGQHGRWAPLSPRYRTWKEKHFPGKPILQLTGRLFGSFSDGHPDHVDRRSETMLEWGSSVPYGIFHQFGWSKSFGGGQRRATLESEIARGIGLHSHPRSGARKAFRRGAEMVSRNVPARRPLDPTQGNVDGLRRAIQRGIVQFIRRRGFAVARGTFGPGESGQIGGGEAFVIGRSLEEGV